MKQTQTMQSMNNAVESVADPVAEKQNELQKRRRRRIRALRSFLFRLVALAIVVYVLLFHVVGLAVMPNGDMSPRLDAGDLLLFYRIDRNPKSQDIVVINRKDNGQRFVLRVIACPGDTVEVSEEKGLAVNGNTQIETNIHYPTRPYENGIEYPLTLKDGEYFVMADYRNGGMDSRFFGPVTQDEIEGIVISLLRRNNL
ncbi:MAG: signal peptidase I [Oscillospiraceae bacterium]|nr:signal peptidase I [Oscillospiraceae bacterium]